MRNHETAGASAADSLTEATALQQSMWPEVPCSAGPMLPGWMTSAELFSSSAALEEFLGYEGSFDPGVDLKSRAAFLMSDYCYIFFMATVPLLVGRNVVPDMSPDSVSLQFYTHYGEHDGEAMTVRRARVRLLSPQIFTDREAGLFRRSRTTRAYAKGSAWASSNISIRWWKHWQKGPAFRKTRGGGWWEMR